YFVQLRIAKVKQTTMNGIGKHLAYYVVTSSPLKPGMPALRRKTFGNVNAAAVADAISDEEIAPGVEDLQVRFGIDTDGNGSVDQYVDPGAVPANAAPVSATLWLRIRSEERESGHVDGTPTTTRTWPPTGLRTTRTGASWCRRRSTCKSTHAHERGGGAALVGMALSAAGADGHGRLGHDRGTARVQMAGNEQTGSALPGGRSRHRAGHGSRAVHDRSSPRRRAVR
ncbi:MAG: PilW family protein, partial [Chromatiales bacterium]|nr:PilW family protein [Chromatiales bacterium]